MVHPYSHAPVMGQAQLSTRILAKVGVLPNPCNPILFFACSAAGAACETWGWCANGEQCATKRSCAGERCNASPGCFIGISRDCPKRTDGWVAGKRIAGPVPPPPPAPGPPTHPKMFTVTDVWKQATVSGSHSSYTMPALASHDSLFITVAPA